MDIRPPRDDLYRSLRPGFELRANPTGSGMPTLQGHFAVFDEWTEIDSVFEGRFLERIARGSFAKTFREAGNRVKVTFNHGHDPSMGDKILGIPDVLREDDTGAWYEVPLLDTSYNRDLLPGLEAGGYGASFRFRVVKENLNAEPERSDYNPDALPERTITEAQLFEFGPVTFPAYEGASAGVRSLTDRFAFERLIEDRDRLRQLLAEHDDAALSPENGAEEAHSEDSREDASTDDNTDAVLEHRAGPDCPRCRVLAGKA